MADERIKVTVDPLVYRRIFQSDPDGQKIMEELLARFYDRSSIGEDPYQTYRKEGQRDVLFFILEKLQQ